ncbi:MAG: hypothetical protein A2504_11065 [Bdellovibrionales bacterium RIFOXYD12_FULL_39_22]|nr:MAG: hypothetical protein A2385_09630 [Bdellovibrionales bacterium RIFOXYB1_FULL_39_21]OFZ44216.1 MAG: hypothetical protein A2485_07250 [Bdellovibrionales bacterium RIFOXYC12_FULL_39_17]OFZ46758.1 MAG: hypothetical protein A2404_04485 [Bdellovibrionales bacterium RIFOXYC1_FULL_39_130]OFZ75965.1 MAG: hypothetical protein A2560_02665 [Bdellovibrionales bacterium RIFOXYD1_FULL_39_84]OFZ95437.1 MAG: hypothetical protein A2504_11065 [Bdellovibrionales bacterium RIFOXYD12_FULL_39_22]HLE09830.1 hy
MHYYLEILIRLASLSLMIYLLYKLPVIISYFRLSNPNFSSSFNNLLNHKRFEFGHRRNSTTKADMREDKRAVDGRKLFIYPPLLDEKLSEKEEKERNKAQRFIENIAAGKESYAKEVSASLEKITKKKFSSAIIVKMAKELLAHNFFFVDREHKIFLTDVQMLSLIVAASFLQAAILELEVGGGRLLDFLVQRKNISSTRLFEALALLLALKNGAVEAVIMEEFVRNKISPKEVAKKLKETKLFGAIISICTDGHGHYGDVDFICKRLCDSAIKMDHFRKNYIAKVQKERTSQKRKEENRENCPAPPKALEEALSIMGCAWGDSEKTVKKRFKRLVLLKHPDRVSNRASSEEAVRAAHEEFVKIKNAYDLIKKCRRAA